MSWRGAILNVRIPESQLGMLDALARAEGVTRSEFARALIAGTIAIEGAWVVTEGWTGKDVSLHKNELDALKAALELNRGKVRFVAWGELL